MMTPCVTVMNMVTDDPYGLFGKPVVFKVNKHVN